LIYLRKSIVAVVQTFTVQGIVWLMIGRDIKCFASRDRGKQEISSKMPIDVATTATKLWILDCVVGVTGPIIVVNYVRR
jgi:hypothetical protein